MGDKKLQLIKTFIEWVLKDYPSIEVKAPNGKYWHEMNQSNIIWNHDNLYKFKTPSPPKVTLKPKLYRRTALRRHYNGAIDTYMAETIDPEHYDIDRRLPDDYTFIRWIDNWTEVTR